MNNLTKQQKITLISIFSILVILIVALFIFNSSSEEVLAEEETTQEQIEELSEETLEEEIIEITTSEQVQITSYSATSDAIRINWEDLEVVDGYRIYMLIDGSYEKVATVDSSILSYRVDGLDSDTDYNFKVKAFIRDENDTAVWQNASEIYIAQTKDEIVEVVTTTAAVTTTTAAVTTTSSSSSSSSSSSNSSSSSSTTTTTAATTTTSAGVVIGDSDSETTTSSTVSAVVLAARAAGCEICGSTSCASLYATNKWGVATVDSELCPEYSIYTDATIYCQDCGKLKGDGTNGTCTQCLVDSYCRWCGDEVLTGQCHTCN